jgi:DNA-binding response OmpR family regulator
MRLGRWRVTDQAPEREQPIVLAADDDEDILELVAFRLERSGYTVVRARDGEEAVELARQAKPDLAVLDVMMPKLDGFEVTRRLRADEATRRMPIILLTARAQDADLQRGFEAGADDYVRKPFSPQELQMRVQSILGRR